MSNLTIEITDTVIIKKSYKGLTGHWTKYGGALYTIYPNQWDRPEVEWICQSCAKEQPKELNPYLFEYPEKEYIRVCSPCFAEDCLKLKKRLGV
jgi:hypothetical protein